MPASKRWNCALAVISSSYSTPTAANTGAWAGELAIGRAVCAAAQIVHEASLLGVAWLCVDSTPTVHSIRDRQSHVIHRSHKRMIFPLRLDFLSL